MLSLQMWQSEFSYLGLILVEKEETLAASGRSNSFESAFVSTFNTDRQRRGLAKLGEDRNYTQTARRTGSKRDTARRHFVCGREGVLGSTVWQ